MRISSYRCSPYEVNKQMNTMSRLLVKVMQKLKDVCFALKTDFEIAQNTTMFLIEHADTQ